MQRLIVPINTHPIFVSLEPQFWDCLEEIAKDRNVSLNALVNVIARDLGGDLASSLRVFVLSHYKGQRGYPALPKRISYH